MALKLVPNNNSLSSPFTWKHTVVFEKYCNCRRKIKYSNWNKLYTDIFNTACAWKDSSSVDMTILGEKKLFHCLRKEKYLINLEMILHTPLKFNFRKEKSLSDFNLQNKIKYVQRHYKAFVSRFRWCAKNARGVTPSTILLWNTD